MNWPPDADGDVFRRLRADGFDFTKTHLVDFNVDFQNWPPPQEAISVLRTSYPSATLYEEGSGHRGYILVQVHSHLNYVWVVQTQKDLSNLMAPYGGSCASWGVLG